MTSAVVASDKTPLASSASLLAMAGNDFQEGGMASFLKLTDHDATPSCFPKSCSVSHSYELLFSTTAIARQQTHSHATTFATVATAIGGRCPPCPLSQK